MVGRYEQTRIDRDMTQLGQRYKQTKKERLIDMVLITSDMD